MCVGCVTYSLSAFIGVIVAVVVIVCVLLIIVIVLVGGVLYSRKSRASGQPQENLLQNGIEFDSNVSRKEGKL